MKHVVVTGATGFIGRWLVKELLQNGISVTAVVRPDSGNLHDLPDGPNLRMVECPMEDYLSLEKRVSLPEGSVFYHLAWKGVSGPDRMKLSTQMENVAASVEAVQAAVRLGCRAYVGLGSIMELESAAVADADGARPGTGYIYGEAKLFAHLATKAVAAQNNIAHVWPILTNAYGEYEYSQRFIVDTLRKILHGEPLEFTAGTQNYDFIHVEDAVRALIAVGEKGIPFHSYVIGSGQAKPLRSFVETIGKELAPDRRLLFGNVPYTGVQLPLERFSIDALAKDTGFMPQISFETGIRRVMEWLKKEDGK